MSALTQPVEQSSRPEKLFFILSGEHASLPAAEIRGILESAGIGFEWPEMSYRLLTLTAPREALRLVSQRSLMFDRCGIVLAEGPTSEEEIIKQVRSLPLDSLSQASESFAVRSARLGGVQRSIQRPDIERELGAVIKRQVPRLSVNLQSPDLTFTCILRDDAFLFGVSAFTKPSGMIAPRRPRKRAIFHPSTMPPKIARCMVNLARAIPGGIFCDPFSGVGGIAIEAGMIGCRVVAIDADRRMLRGAQRNMRQYNLEALGYLNGDARFVPLHDVDSLATDPPYGRGSSTMGAKVPSLVEDFLKGARSVLKRRAHLCISAPTEVEVEHYAGMAGFVVRERHLAKIHRSLTRQFVVLQNP